MSDVNKNTNEPQVHAQVLAEIQKIGAKSEENYIELAKNYNNLKHTLNESASGNQSKIEKLKEDILTRQESMDQLNAKIQKRIDDFEVSMKRPGIISGTDNSKLEKEAIEFEMQCKAARNEAMTHVQRKEFRPNVERYSQYKTLFKEYLRTGDKFLNSDESKTLSVGVDPHGGYTVTPEVSARVIEKIYETDPIRQLSNVESISTDAIEYPVDWDEFSAGWVGETGTRSTTDTADMSRKRIVVHEMYAQPKATQQLLEDSALNIESWISNKVADRFSRLEGAAFVEGDGTNKPRGFLTYANGTTYGTIQQINMGAAATLTPEGFVKVKYGLTEFYLNRGTWLMNRLSVRDAMELKDGTGNFIWKPALAVDSPSTILSLPVRMSTTMPEVNADALSVALADWRAAYTIVDRIAMTVLRDPYTDKPFVIFYTRRRVGGDVVNYDAIKIGKIAA